MTVRDGRSQVIWAGTLAVMVGCLGLALLPFVQALQPGWNAAGLPGFAAGAALLGYGWGRAGPDRDTDRWQRLQLRVVQLGALLIGLQLYVVLAAGPSNRDLLSLHPQALLPAAALVVAWSIGRQVAGDLGRLGEATLDDGQYVPPERRLAVHIFSGGAVMFLLVGLTQGTLVAAAHLPRTTGPAPVLSLLAYFVCGLLMLGRFRYALLQRRWEDRQTAIPSQLGRRWLASSTVVVAVLLLGTLAIWGRSFGLEDVPHVVATQMQSLLTSSSHANSQPTPSRLHQGPYKTHVYHDRRQSAL